ncbi:MAG: ParB/RepB/Spo0J family partition protein [Leptolyngbyaceae cyanobacterium]
MSMSQDSRECFLPSSYTQTGSVQGKGSVFSTVERVQPQADKTQTIEGQPSDRKGTQQWIPIEHIVPGQFQPRQYFDESEIESLAQDFEANRFRGALNVRPLLSGQYELVAGERRWRAAQKAGLKKVFCLIDHFSDEEALEFSLVENLKRSNLSKLEETIGILKLIELRYGISQEQASKIRVST